MVFTRSIYERSLPRKRRTSLSLLLISPGPISHVRKNPGLLSQENEAHHTQPILLLTASMPSLPIFQEILFFVVMPAMIVNMIQPPTTGKIF